MLLVTLRIYFGAVSSAGCLMHRSSIFFFLINYSENSNTVIKLIYISFQSSIIIKYESNKHFFRIRPWSDISIFDLTFLVTSLSVFCRKNNIPKVALVCLPSVLPRLNIYEILMSINTRQQVEKYIYVFILANYLWLYKNIAPMQFSCKHGNVQYMNKGTANTGAQYFLSSSPFIL